MAADSPRGIRLKREAPEGKMKGFVQFLGPLKNSFNFIFCKYYRDTCCIKTCEHIFVLKAGVVLVVVS